MTKPPFIDYLVIGGGIAGTTAAETIRSEDSSSSIFIISHEKHPLYSRVLLPKYIQDKIDREKVFLRSLEHYTNSRIDILLDEDVVSIDFDKQEAITQGKQVYSYKKLLIATGGVPNKWMVKGSELPYIFQLQTIEDADAIYKRVKSSSGRVVVVGGGFIGIEFLNIARTYGFDVDLILRQKQCFEGRLEEEGWKILSAHMEQNGVSIYPETEIKELQSSGDIISVITNKPDQALKASWIGVGVGLMRPLNIFQGLGMKTNKGICVNEFLETSLENVWAAGDGAEYFDPISGAYELGANWTNAFLQGRIAGLNMVGKKTAYKSVTTFSIALFDLHITFVGRALEGEGIESVIRLWPDHKNYERLFFKNNIVVGAVLFNRFQDKVAITKLIENKTEINESNIRALKDINFDVASLL